MTASEIQSGSRIDWTPPPPRTGLAGEWDRFVGPGQTQAELWLILLPALAGGLAVPLYALQNGLGWTAWQLAAGGLLALDLIGGVTANAATPAKRWYHRPGQGGRQHLQFIAVHGLYILLVAWLFRGLDWAYVGVFTAYLLAAGLMVARAPLRLQRPLALLLYTGALLLNLYALPPAPGMEWFLPVLFLKLLVGHLLKEAPWT